MKDGVEALWASAWLRRAITGFGCLLLALNLLDFPRQAYTLEHDMASEASFEYYAAKHFQFGQQVYQNVGPYGYVHYGYTYTGIMPIRKVILKNVYRLGLLLLILWLARRLPHPGLKFAWLSSFFLLLPLSYQAWPVSGLPPPAEPDVTEFDWDQVYSYVTLYLAALYLLQRRRDWRFCAVSGALLGLLGFVALTKHTSFILAAFVVSAVSFQKLLQKEFWAGLLLPAGFAGFLILFWLMAGQKLENLPAFARGIFLFSSGYNEAMMEGEGFGAPLVALAILALLAARSLYNWLALRQGAGRILIEAALLSYSGSTGLSGPITSTWRFMPLPPASWRSLYSSPD
jgi:hypothetical protein